MCPGRNNLTYERGVRSSVGEEKVAPVQHIKIKSEDEAYEV